jgi:hypothetical protein
MPMSYRDDVDALFHRARTLQAEVDRLRGELAARDAPPADSPIARMEPPPTSARGQGAPLRRVHDRQVLADDILFNLERAQARAAWLPADALEVVDEHSVELGLLVARCSEVEHVLLMRLLELITADDFDPAAVARNQADFDQLAAELRRRLDGPG